MKGWPLLSSMPWIVQMLGMVKQGGSPRLAGETFQRFGVAGQVLRNEFQRDVPP